MRVGETVLRVSENKVSPVTIKKIVRNHPAYGHDIILVKECEGHLTYADILTKSQVLAMFEGKKTSQVVE